MRSPSSAPVLALLLPRLLALLALAAIGCGDDDVGVTPAADAGADAAMHDAGVPIACFARVPVGGACAVIGDCDNGCFCDGAEQCTAGVCVAGAAPCADAIACTTDTCNESVRGCAHVARAAACSDADFCNGSERCDAELGCQPGSVLVCDDEDDCTTDTCEAASGCVNQPQDRDGDGFGDGFCGGTDCVDDPARGGATVGPGRTEICDNDLDDDCDGLRDYAATACVPTNDTCATARVLPGAGSYSGSLRGLVDNYLLACLDGFPGGSVGDAVYRVTLAEVRDLVVRVRSSRSSFGTATTVVVRRFADCATGPDLRTPVCGNGAAMRVRSAPAGDYAIIVSGEPSGAFDLIVEIGAPTEVPLIDVCDATTLDVSAGGSFAATRGDIRDDYALSCNPIMPPQTRADGVYRLVLDAPKDVRIDLRPLGALALVGDCADAASTLVCTPDRFGGASSIFRRSLRAGTYFIIAEPNFDGRGGSSDDFVLDVRVTDPSVAPPADSCTSAAPLTVGVELVTPIDALTLDVGLSCASTSGSLLRDVVYSFTTTIPQDVTLRVAMPSAFTGDVPALALTTSCGEAVGERSCGTAEGASAITRTWRSLPAGTWYAVVGTAASSGSLSALLSTAPATAAPSNDNCATPTTLVSGVAAMFMPTSYDDDLTVSCGSGGAPDATYQFTLTRRQAVDLSASPLGSFGTVRVALRSSCAAGPDLACTSADDMTASISTTLDAGTYFVVVEASTRIPQVRITPFFTDL